MLVSSGRCGQTGSLGLDKVGISTSERGHVRVNAHFQTTLPHVYAAGDVIGSPALASTSMEQARLAMAHAFDLKYKTGIAPILPYGVYTIPEASMAGATEEELQKEGVPYVAGRASYAANARGQIIGDHKGFLKLLFHEEDMKLLGVHMIGELATELVHVGLTALLTGSGADLFISSCYNYPTLTEVYKYATYDALGQPGAARLKERAAAPPRGDERAGAVGGASRAGEGVNGRVSSFPSSRLGRGLGTVDISSRRRPKATPAPRGPLPQLPVLQISS